MLKQTVYMDTTELSERRADRSHQPITVPFFFCSLRLWPVVFMVLQNGAKRILDFVDLQDTKPVLVASIGLWVAAASDDLLPRDNVVYRDLDDVFRTVLDVGENRKV